MKYKVVIEKNVMTDKLKIERLQNSPMFQLSLGSKELFHSNFLYWLWKAEPNIFGEIMKSFGIDFRNDIVVKREWENFDLSLVRMDTRKKRGNGKETEYVEYVKDVVAVIENKVKSLPRKEQLNKYDGKIKKVDKDEKCTKILLSLPNPEFDIKDSKWRYIHYEDYVNALRNNINKASSAYNQAVLKDYCQLLDTLCVLKEEWLCGGDEAFLNMRYTSILKRDDDKKMRELRINDIRHKIIYSQMSELIRKRLCGYSDKVDSGSNFTNSTGIVEAHIYMNKEYEEHGVQVQGSQYRRFIIKGDKSIDEAKCADRIMNSYPKQCLGREFKHEGKYKSWGSYGDTFRYLYITISDEATVKDVIDQMVTDIKFVVNKYPDEVKDISKD